MVYTDPIIGRTTFRELIVTKRVHEPGVPFDADGGNLSFCPGETKTVFIPGLSEASCGWHHEWRYIAPAGWTIANNDPFFLNRRTTSENFVQVTAPTNAVLGADLSRVFKVESEPAWPWYVSNEAIITVGYSEDISVSGPSLLCNNAQATYALSNVPSGASVTWSHSSNLSIVSGQGTSSLEVFATEYIGGTNGWVQAEVVGNCGNALLDPYSMWIGGPMAPTTNPSGVPAIATNTGANVTINITEVFGDTGGLYSINWSTNDPSSLGLTCNDDICVVECLKAGYNYVYVSATNSCGQGLARQIPFDVTNGGGGGGVCCPHPQIVIGPNPTTDWVDITFTNQEELESYYGKEKMNFKVIITDMTGDSKYHGVINKNGLKVNLKHADEGIYLVKVYGKDFEHTSRLRIN